jgi:hypothetical protein
MGGTVLTSYGAQNSTSGTSVDFSSIPSWVKRITVLFNAISTNGTSQVMLQLGVSGTPETTNYLGAISATAGASTASASHSSGFLTSPPSPTAAYTLHGAVTFELLSTNLWVCSGFLANSDLARNVVIAGTKTLAGTLDMVRITTVNGTDAFDNGSINVLYS